MIFKPSKTGLTLVEILIVVAVLALLSAGLFFVSNEVRKQAQVRMAESTLALLDTALQEYYDYDKRYPPDLNYADPLDLGNPHIELALGPPGVAGPPIVDPLTAGYQNDPKAESVEVLYYYLNRLPQSRQTLSKLGQEAISGKAVKLDPSNKPLPSRTSDPDVLVTFTIGGTPTDVGLPRIIDPWNMPLRYSRPRDPANLADETGNFPKIESAGPDRTFGTADDIVNKKN